MSFREALVGRRMPSGVVKSSSGLPLKLPNSPRGVFLFSSLADIVYASAPVKNNRIFKILVAMVNSLLINSSIL